MQIVEKNIITNRKPYRTKKLRFIFYDYNGHSIDYITQNIRKKCIYFDYLIVVKKDGGWRNIKRRIYDNNLNWVDHEKYTESSWFNYDSIIEKYITSKEFRLMKRQNKLERILNE